MIAVNLETRRIIFTAGLTDKVKKKLVMDLWIARPFISENYPLPPLKEYEKDSRKEGVKLDDKVYF